MFRRDGLTIERDEHGVPHITAADEPDRYWGLGYVHGKDRATQMVLGRILAQGRICELLQDNDDNLQADIAFRRWGFFVDADAEIDALAEDTRTLADAYCAGVNAAFAEGLGWPLRIAGIREAEAWVPADSIALTRLMSHFGLSQSQENFERTVLELIQGGVDIELLEALLPGRLDGLDVDLVRQLQMDPVVLPEGVRSKLPGFAASNNWVVSGARSASGKPMLANDPHLEVNRLPAIWQEIVLEDGAGWYAMGATVPGLPALIIGRTPHTAWGVTYAYQDGTDSWIEEVDGGRFRRDTRAGRSSWHHFDERAETIRRKRGDDHKFTVYENDHGTLQSTEPTDGYHLCTRWAPGRGTGAVSLQAGVELLHARTAAETLDALGRLETPWNWVACDAAHIGYQMSGKVPKRPAHMTGFVPLPGWDPRNDWQGFLAPRDLPRCMDPGGDYFATANNDLQEHAKGAGIQNVTMGDYRVDAIRDRLRDRTDWTTDAMQELQLGDRSEQAIRFLAILRPLLSHSDVPPRHQQILGRWRGTYDSGSRGAWLFEQFYRRLLVDVLGRALDETTAAYLLNETGLVAGFHALIDDTLVDPDSPWYRGEGRDRTWIRILNEVCRGRIRTWGTTASFRMRHILLGAAPGASFGPVRLGGGRCTILQFQAFDVDGRPTTFAPSYRFIVDMAKPGAQTILAGGPTDRPMTKLYASEVRDWEAGRLKDLQPMTPPTTAP